MKLTPWYLAWCITIAIPLLFSNAEAATSFLLRVGEQKSLRLPEIRRYSTGGTAIRVTRVEEAGQETLLVKGSQSGFSDLTVWLQDGAQRRFQFEVVSVDKKRETTVPPLKSWVQSLDGVEYGFLSSQDPKSPVLISGEVSDLSTAREIRRMQVAYPDLVQNRTYPSAEHFRNCLGRLEPLITQIPDSELSLEFSEKSRWITIQGSIESDSLRKTIESRAMDACPWVQFSLQSISEAVDVIRLKVFLLELRHHSRRLMGLSPAAENLGTLALSSAGIQSAIGLTSTLQALEVRGQARILSQPEFVLRTPGEAELFSGGEIPVETKTPFQSQVAWKNIGLSVKVKTLSNTRKTVRLDISAEASQLDPRLSKNEHPGIQANRLKTQVEARFSKPLLLSGLYQSAQQKGRSGIPLLGRLPFLGLLFSSEESLDDETELLAVLLPEREPPKISLPKLGAFKR